MTPNVIPRNIPGDRRRLLEIFKPSHKIFALVLLIAEVPLGYGIVKLSGLIQILCLIGFFFIMLGVTAFVFVLLYKELSLSYKKQERISKEKEKVSKEKEIITQEKDAIEAGYGIKNYWRSRDDAIDDIKKEMFKTKQEIFISGITLHIFFPLLQTAPFINKLWKHINNNNLLRLTFVTLNPEAKKIYDTIKDHEAKILDLDGSWRNCLVNLRSLKKQLSAKLGKDSKKLKKIEFKHYSKIIPRHFIVKLDDTLYVSSYFSHGMGATACLLKLENIGEGCLYELFDHEVEYIRNNSKEFDPQKLKVPRMKR